MNMPVPPATAPTLSQSEIEQIRAHHRDARDGGLMACLIGVLVMVAGRFMPGAPTWLTSLGVGIVVFGWGLFAFAFIRRLALARTLAARARF